MNKYYSLIVSLLFPVFLLFNACDKIDPPYIVAHNNGTDTTEVRKFLLEEFTGHTCPNCPQGAVIAQNLKAYYGERLILISIHAGEFADPGIGEFAPNYHCATGEEIFNFFTPITFPCGMVSRTGWSPTQNNAVLNKNAWGPQIESLKSLEPEISIDVSNTYAVATRTVTASVECDALQNLTGTYKIAAYLSEDSLISAQATENDVNYQDNIIHNYVHRHVLRGALNSTWGDTLTSGNTFLGTQFLKEYNMILNPAWNENHCYVVVFVYDASNYEILQVEEKRVK